MANVLLILPELTIFLAAILVFKCLILGLSVLHVWRVAFAGSLLGLGACLITLGMTGEPFHPGIYRVDLFSQLMKTVIAAALVLVLVLSDSPPVMRRDAWRELPFFLLLSSAGLMMMTSATELITLYLALELSAFPVYALIVLHRDRRMGSEGATKYMLQGMVASAVTLYGMSFIFGLSGTTYLSEIAAALPELGSQPLFWVGLLLLLAGFLFKLALFPFHFWAPDTYFSSPHPVATFIATVSKVAAIAVLCRMVAVAGWNEASIDGETLRIVLIVLAVAAMTLGNLAALVQKDFKRLLGYSAIAHAGYIVVALQAFSSLGHTAIVFYTIGYLAMTWICFMVACEVGRNRDTVPVSALAGLWQRSPMLALCLLIGIFGLTGLPPTVGFIGKWFLFSAALEDGQFLLVLIAALNSAVAVYYYMRVLRVAYLLEPAKEDTGILAPSPLVVTGAMVACLVVLWMGVAPNYFWEIAAEAIVALGATY
ncbi:MAG: NADH-quinone oxidoreductase subunit N [Candidatus Sumerlaeia bacterium]|nr:NADH-quinone oxidoreductase subunit N [Candidatus Sumerlaeia bacterium]